MSRLGLPRLGMPESPLELVAWREGEGVPGGDVEAVVCEYRADRARLAASDENASPGREVEQMHAGALRVGEEVSVEASKVLGPEL